MSIRLTLLSACLLALSAEMALARTIIVDQSGLGQYTSI